MQVDGVNPGNGLALGLSKLQAEENNGEEGVPEPTVSNETPEDTAAIQISDGTTESGEELPGVIRHLMDGHYNGVSDVRLRINFNDELEAIEAAELKAAAEDGIADLLASVTAGIEPLVGLSGPDEEEEVPPEGEGETLVATTLVATIDEEAPEEEGPPSIGELAEQFVSVVNVAKEEFLAAESPSQEGLVGDLTSAFDALVGSLWDLYGPVEDPGGGDPPGGDGEEAPGGGEGGDGGGEEPGVIGESGGVAVGAILLTNEEVLEVPPVEERPGDDGGEEEEPPDAGDYITALESSFGTALAELISSLEGVSVLPELSEPSGNGVAYDKFVAIYNELQGVVETGTVDAVG